MSEQRNQLVDQQTLFNLSRAVNDANLGVQLATTKLYGMMTWGEVAPDELFTECGATLATLRQAVSKLETFLFVLSEWK